MDSKSYEHKHYLKLIFIDIEIHGPADITNSSKMSAQ